MRRSAADKARSRERILDVAAVRVREAGLDGPSVADVMREAGMTHGGFYKHFDSRDELVLAAVERALGESDAAVGALLADVEDPLAAFVDWYVSAEHAADPGHWCAVTALAGEMTHADEPVRDAYRRQVERYLRLLERLLGNRRAANVALSTLVGAVTVARALGDPVLAEPILRDVRRALRESRQS